jgi:hypothetical protein
MVIGRLVDSYKKPLLKIQFELVAHVGWFLKQSMNQKKTFQ